MLSKRIRTLLLGILAVMMLLPVQTLAVDAIDVDAEASLHVQITPDGQPQENVELRLYRVAEVAEQVEFTLTGAFAEYSVSLNDNTAESWRDVATTLDGYVRTDAIAPDYTAKTDADGVAAFTGLPTGLYLVAGDRWYASERAYYTPTSFLVSLPNQGVDGEWIYDVRLNAKLVPGEDEPDKPDDGPDYTEISVLKVWEDNGSESRPTEIVVELYDGSELEDTVTLSKENNWQHIWRRLDEDGDWIVREKEVPAGYSVTIEKQGSRFVLTNTLPDSPPPPDVPDTPDTPEIPETPGAPGLPQTGVLWWPVPVLLAGGLALILLGVLRRRNDYED